MKIILAQDFESLGFEGDVIDVARGYARNYLIPQALAVEANNANLKGLESRKTKIMAKRLRDKEAAEQVKEKISHITLTFKHKAGEEGKLYGSVTSRDIIQKLEKEGFTVDRKKIVIDEAIRSLGEFQVAIKLYPEVTAILKVIVEAEENEALDKDNG